MTKKLLVIFGIAAVAGIAGYMLRDRIIAGALALADKLNSLADDPSEDTWGLEKAYEEEAEGQR